MAVSNVRCMVFSAALALAGLFGAAAPAAADVSITITIGPGYNLVPGPGRLSCRTVANRLLNRGYRYIRVADCRGATYVYNARRNGNLWQVYASSRNGSVNRRVKLR